MNTQKIKIELRLPNGKWEKFSILSRSDQDWQMDLRAKLQKYYPGHSAFPECPGKAGRVRFVENLPRKRSTLSRPFKSSVMFEIRNNYYALGYFTAKLSSK